MPLLNMSSMFEGYSTPGEFDSAPPLWMGDNETSMLLEELFQSIIVWGATGVGKTSSSGKRLFKACARLGFGALVLCVKSDEPRNIAKWAKECGRTPIMFNDRSGLRFNFLQWYIHRTNGTGSTKTLGELLETVLAIVQGNSTKSDRKVDFWNQTRALMLGFALEILRHSSELSLKDVLQLVESAPKSAEDAAAVGYEASFCGVACKTAKDAVAADPELTRLFDADLKRAIHYWTVTFPSMESRTRNDAVSTLVAHVSELLTGSVSRLFCTGDSNITPDTILDDGALLIVDMPIDEDPTPNSAANAIWKTLFYWAAVSRKMTDDPEQTLPCIIYADEAQKLAAITDQDYLARTRSYRVGSIFLSQNIPIYRDALGGQSGDDKLKGLLGNMRTVILHQNACPETYEYYNKVLGNELKPLNSWNSSFSFGPVVGSFLNDGGTFAALSQAFSQSEGVSMQLLPKLMQQDVSFLRTGSRRHEGFVDGIWMFGASKRPNEKSWMPFTTHHDDEI